MRWRESLSENVSKMMVKTGCSGAKPFAKKCGVSDTIIRQIVNKTGNPGIEKLEQIADACGASLYDLLPQKESHEEALNKTLKAYSNIPLYSAEASLGKGMIVDNEYVEDVVSFRESWLRQELRVDPNQLSMVFATGDSMSPTIQSGEMVMIDHSAVDKITDGIWALTMGGGLMVKRVQAVSKTSLQIISDNKAYDTKNIDLNNPQDGFNLIGRVVWHGRRV